VEGQSPDESFVLAFEQEDSRSDPYFAIIFTTPRIIDGTHLTRPVEMDETYKLIYEGYAVTVMGQTDGDRRFHPRAVGVSTNGNERVGKFYLQAWKERVPLFTPRAYLGDAAQAFANAALSVFPSIDVRLMCFAHVYKVRQRLDT
jgi:hypothetical protein